MVMCLYDVMGVDDSGIGVDDGSRRAAEASPLRGLATNVEKRVGVVRAVRSSCATVGVENSVLYKLHSSHRFL